MGRFHTITSLTTGALALLCVTDPLHAVEVGGGTTSASATPAVASRQPPNPARGLLLGRWRSSKDGEEIVREYLPDGTWRMDLGGGRVMNGTYQWVDAQRLRMTLSGGASYLLTTQVTRNALALTSADGGTLKESWTRDFVPGAQNQLLLGRWRSSTEKDKQTTREYYQNGTWRMELEGGGVMSGTYRWVDASRLRMTLSGGASYLFDTRLSQNSLELTSADGGTMKESWTRQ